MRKIGELKGKPIIEGNPNEIKNNQIHYKESEWNINLSERKNGILETISNNSSSGSSSSDSNGLYYYKRILKRQHTDITDIFNSVMIGLSTYLFIPTSFIPYGVADPNDMDIMPALYPISQFNGDDRYIAYIIFDISLPNNSCFNLLGDSYPGDEAIDQLFNRTVNKSVEEILDYIAELGEPKALLLKEEFLKEYIPIDNLNEEYKEIVKNYFKNNIG